VTLAIVGARVWTGDPVRPWAEAVGVAGERIAAVGSDAEVRARVGPRTRVIDARGRLVVPGFVDAHTHFVSGGFGLLGVRLRDADTPDEFVRRLAEHARRLPPGRWITGGEWDHERWPGAPLPRRDWIDSVTPDHPVFVTRLDGHMGLANTRALREAGIARGTPAPPGGVIVRDPATGEPTGILKDAAMALVTSRIPAPSDDEMDEALEAALRHAAALGVTTIHDMGAWRDLEAYRRFRARDALTVRVHLYTPLPEWQRLAEEVARAGRGDAWLRIGGVKGFVDGSLGSSTAYFREPYADDPSNRGVRLHPVDSLRAWIFDADRAGLQLAVHAIGDEANRILLDLYEALVAERGPRDRRLRVEHAQHLLPEDIPRFAALGVIPSMQPYHAIDDGRWAERKIGPARARTTYAFRSLLDAGARLAFGSDWNVAPLDPLQGIYAAVTRRTLDGAHPDGWVPEQKIGVEDALRAYTGNGAYAVFREGELGTIAPGKLADLVVLDRDLFAVGPAEIRDARADLTVVGGRIVYEREAP
jgi:predicted amidohydrolase YtcJ